MIPGPQTGILIFIAAGVAGLVSYVAMEAARELTFDDLRPMSPSEGPPLPVFTKTKPGVLSPVGR